jgi:hypothetical protein
MYAVLDERPFDVTTTGAIAAVTPAGIVQLIWSSPAKLGALPA